MSTIPAPSDWVENVSRLRLPHRADQRLQVLMDRNNEEALSKANREELDYLIEICDAVFSVRVEALHLLAAHPHAKGGSIG